MWEQLSWWASDVWEALKSWYLGLWRCLGNRTVGTLLTAVPAALASYFALQASLQANETSERSLQVAKSSQRLAEAAEARQQRENSAEIFAKLDKEKCWQVSASDASCRFFFTLTNAGKNTAEHLVSVVSVRSLSLKDNLAGDLPAGQVATNVTRDFEFDKRAKQDEEVVLAVAFQDKTMHTCEVKSWAFRAVPTDEQLDRVDFVGASDEENLAQSAEQEARWKLRSGLDSGSCANLPD